MLLLRHIPLIHETGGRRAAGRMAPVAQFQLPTVRVLNPTEPSVRFRGERGRFSRWVRAANVGGVNRTDLTL